jgi:hypothetical protein
MARKRGSSHTTLTETADEVVRVLMGFSGIKMIAPGIIDARRSGKRYVTAVYTTAGMELIISGTGVQKVAVHLSDPTAAPAHLPHLKPTKPSSNLLGGSGIRNQGKWLLSIFINLYLVGFWYHFNFY